MHLKSIPEMYSRSIKARAASKGMSPSQYFVHLHLNDLAEPLPAEHETDQHRSQSQGQSKKKKKRR